MPREISLLSMPLPAKHCGIFKWAARSMPRPLPSPSTERNMWQSPPAALCMRLDCLKNLKSKIPISEPRHHSRGESQVVFVSRETLEDADIVKSASVKLIQIEAGAIPIQLR